MGNMKKFKFMHIIKAGACKVVVKNRMKYLRVTQK